MLEIRSVAAATRAELYASLVPQVESLLAGERDTIANAANIASLLYHTLPDINWAGFYFLKGDQLVLGPFHGKPACVRIAVGRGVCGTAAHERRTQVVADVDQFPGHIACDAASRSELVVPIVVNGAVLGVLDIDSPVRGRFDDDDRVGLERIADIFVRSSDFGV